MTTTATPSQSMLDNLNQAGQSVLEIGDYIRKEIERITEATSTLYTRLNGGAISNTDLVETAKVLKTATDNLSQLDKKLEAVGSQLSTRLKPATPPQQETKVPGDVAGPTRQQAPSAGASPNQQQEHKEQQQDKVEHVAQRAS